MTAYAVTAPLVVVRDSNGAMHHVYEKGLLPGNADADHVKQLLADKMIEKVKEPAEPKADDKDQGDGAPKGNASRADWAEYAKAKGASEEELKDPADGGLTQSQLREKFGK